MSSFLSPDIGVWLYPSQVNGFILSLSNSNPLGIFLKTTEHNSMLDFARRSFNGLKHTARKSRCSQLLTQLHAWGGCRGHAILIKAALSPSMPLPETGSPCFSQEEGDKGWQYLDHFIFPRECLLAVERHKWILIHGCSLETSRKLLKCLERQIWALTFIRSLLHWSKHGVKPNE